MIQSPSVLSVCGRMVFLASAALILYVIFGYPVLLAWLARRKNRPISTALKYRSVSVLLPVRDGGRWVRAKLESILQLQYPRELLQIVVVSDGSSDGTDETIRDFAASGVELLRIERSGKAAAINAGLERCRGDIVFFTDVRQQLAPDSLQRLVACFADPEVGVVSGELMSSRARICGRRPISGCTGDTKNGSGGNRAGSTRYSARPGASMPCAGNLRRRCRPTRWWTTCICRWSRSFAVTGSFSWMPRRSTTPPC